MVKETDERARKRERKTEKLTRGRTIAAEQGKDGKTKTKREA